MYYITNQENDIIAVDNSLLPLLGVKNLNELYAKMAREEIVFLYLSDESVIVETPYGENSYTLKKTALSGLLGAMTLVELEVPANESSLAANTDRETYTSKTDEKDLLRANGSDLPDSLTTEDIFNIDIDDLNNKDLISIKESADQNLSAPQENKEDQLLLLEDDSIHMELPQKVSLPEKEKNDDLFDLILPSEADEHISEIQTKEQQKFNAQADSAPAININAAQLSKKIGISIEDYNIFLNEYIDTALMLEDDLQDTDTNKQKNAIETLLHLSNVLGISTAAGILAQIDKADESDKKTLTESFYTVLSRLTTYEQPEESHDKFTAGPEVETHMQPEIQAQSAQGFGTIDLKDVKPIHFDFQLEQAANDLNLPVELIKEFVHDFIEQAHTETQKMLEAYQKGDLSAIQKIGHLLKGASSNLRIDPLANTLYDIQFCEDSSRLEDLIKRYWGHFLSFETQINLTSR